MPAPETTRTVSAHLEAEVTEPAEIVLTIATSPTAATETLEVTVDGRPVRSTPVIAADGTRMHLLPEVAPGFLVVDYRATVVGEPARPPADPERDALERIVYLRPSRYCESDTLTEVAHEQFTGLAGKELLDAVSSWVGQRLAYVGGWSRPTDGALDVYLARRGVCRDFAHLVVAMLRAMGMPARLVAVYAPGLAPMDFHAVAEARLDDGWYVVDATALAPRAGMLRIATGRDAADTSFLTVHSGRVELTGMSVTATMDPALPSDDLTELFRLA